MENLADHKFCPGFSGIKRELFIMNSRQVVKNEMLIQIYTDIIERNKKTRTEIKNRFIYKYNECFALHILYIFYVYIITCVVYIFAFLFIFSTRVNA